MTAPKPYSFFMKPVHQIVELDIIELHEYLTEIINYIEVLKTESAFVSTLIKKHEVQIMLTPLERLLLKHYQRRYGQKYINTTCPPSNHNFQKLNNDYQFYLNTENNLHYYTLLHQNITQLLIAFGKKDWEPWL
ncbi:MAG: hypothetical protein FWE56_04560 [Candidatus Bathyarchaeota archaeon]|nr:hypothetical protein [Candidatus Termiticorpusculum sp.]MCL2868827.1 hypothetical protein [Candidatus Termiticorpusculum sp.]